MQEPDLKEIETKLDKGEDLTPAEKHAVMEIPPVEGDDEPEENPDEKLKVEPEKEPEPEEAVEEETDEEEPQDEKNEKEEEKPEEKPSEKDAESAEASKKEAEEAAKKETDAARRAQIEQDAEKDLDQVDISKYSPNERAIFFELKQERRKRQAAQRDADTLRFQKLQDEKKRELEAKSQPVVDPFEGMEEDDLLTVGQIKKVLSPKQQAPKPEVNPQVNQILAENWVLKGKAVYTDLPEVMMHAQAILGDDRDAEEEVKEVIKKGGNPAIAVYNLIKASPKWADLEKKLNPPKEEAPVKKEKKLDEDARINKDRAERIETNKKKTVTTGGSGGPASRPSEYSLNELLAMPDHDFAKLPAAQRRRILEQL
jgi:hypothetical protein